MHRSFSVLILRTAMVLSLIGAVAMYGTDNATYKVESILSGASFTGFLIISLGMWMGVVVNNRMDKIIECMFLITGTIMMAITCSLIMGNCDKRFYRESSIEGIYIYATKNCFMPYLRAYAAFFIAALMLLDLFMILIDEFKKNECAKITSCLDL